jgi:chaperonin GroEL
LALTKLAGTGHGLDARSGKIVDVVEAGIRDVADVQKRAVRSAVRSAALALTVDVLIHRKEPEQSVEP